MSATKPTTRRLLFPALCLLLTLLLCGAAYMLVGELLPEAVPTSGNVTSDTGDGADTTDRFPWSCVVIDAGHGGEDGGAQSATGLYEKDVNLAVATYLRDYLEAAGIPTVMTRTEDKLLYDPTSDYKGRKKVLDLAARLEIATSVPDSLFISIHMNAFPQTQYSGLQVWYSPAHPASEQVAGRIQAEALRLDPGNHRRIKAAGSGIFLLDRLDTPAVLVECGFLSNPDEAARLGDAAYRRRLAFVIFTALTAGA